MQKPAKPRPDFPLFAHNCGKWAKKINGKLKYFGRWDNPEAALAEYEAAKSTDTVSVDSGLLTLADACNLFLTFKDQALSAGEITRHSFSDYRRTCEWLVKFFGREIAAEILTPSQFGEYKAELAKRRSALSLGNEITRVKTVFKWLWEQRMLAAPMHFGSDFRKASQKTLRIHRNAQGKKLFTREQVRELIEECGTHLRAMTLLGINCGYGPSDISTLPLAAVDVESGLASHPRPKTGIERRCPLWPETVAALKASLAARVPLTDHKLPPLFFTRRGEPWQINRITKQFRQAMMRAGFVRGGSYWLRHTLETVGGGSKDQVALNAIMGHVDSSMAAQYREEIGDDRLIAVTDHVRRWLFG